jgi:hypothetical protein
MPYNGVMNHLERLCQYHSHADALILLAGASALAKEKPDIGQGDVQDRFRVGYESAVIILDWLADNDEIRTSISKHWVRAGRAYVLNNPFPYLEGMKSMLKIGERRAHLVMQALQKRKIIIIKPDFSFERVGRAASFADLVRQMKPIAKKYHNRCEPLLLMRTIYIDWTTAMRLAQYGEEFLGLKWKKRPKELM